MGLVSTHQLSTFTTPVNGTSPIDANQVKGNDNSIKTSYNAHDADTTIHLQSGAVATRPAASTAGQTWLATDSGAVYLWLDNGSAWVEANYLRSTGGTVTGNVLITGTLGVTGATTLSSTLTIGGVTYTFPASQGANQYLKTDGSGNLSWVTFLETLALTDLSDVTITSVASGQFLLYNGTVWVNGTNGSALTTLNASNLSSGTVNTARIAGSYTGITAVGTLTAGAISTGFTAIADTYLATISTAGKVSNSATTATNANTASAIVARDASGNFTAGTVTAALTGNATTATTLATARAINGVNFDGSAAITVPAAAGTLTGTTLASNVVTSSLTAVGTLVTGAIGTGFTAIPNSALANSSITLNGTVASLGSSYTLTAAAGTLTGTTLSSNVTLSSLTSVGTLSAGAVPASLVTAGTFGAGAYTFPGALAITGALTGVTTGTFSGAVSTGALTSTTGTFTGALAATLSTAAAYGLTITNANGGAGTAANITVSNGTAGGLFRMIGTGGAGGVTTPANGLLIYSDGGVMQFVSDTSGLMRFYTGSQTLALTISSAQAATFTGAVTTGALTATTGTFSSTLAVTGATTIGTAQSTGAYTSKFQVNGSGGNVFVRDNGQELYVGYGGIAGYIGTAYTGSTLYLTSGAGSVSATITPTSFAMPGTLAVSDNVTISATKKIYLGTNTYFSESSANIVTFVTGNVAGFSLATSAVGYAGSFTTTAAGGGSVLNVYNTNSGVATDNSMVFVRNGSTAGSITTTLALVTTYNTTSDSRLKEDLGIVTDLSGLQSLVIRDYTRPLDGSRGRGVFAQEAVTANIPDFITVGDDELNDDGLPVKPWMADYSKVIPDLIAGWQNHEARMAELELLRARVAALEAV